jgi:hypothetical protein
MLCITAPEIHLTLLQKGLIITSIVIVVSVMLWFYWCFWRVEDL